MSPSNISLRASPTLLMYHISLCTKGDSAYLGKVNTVSRQITSNESRHLLVPNNQMNNESECSVIFGPVTGTSG